MAKKKASKKAPVEIDAKDLLAEALDWVNKVYIKREEKARQDLIKRIKDCLG